MRTLHNPLSHHFASDNYAGIHPDVLAAIQTVNGGHQSAYGKDEYTAAFEARIREIFGRQAEAFVVLNGTGANVLALQAMTGRGEAVMCSDTAHINTDETGAPEHVGGLKLLSAASTDGKITPDQIDTFAYGHGDQHRAQARVLSLTQATELGTCYQVDELAALAERAHGYGMSVHLDGARIANAAAFLNVGLREITTDLGIDVLSLGGTKLGALAAEALVVVNPDAVQGLPYLRKASLQLASKGRFISAQLLALYREDLWLRIAQHTNDMAKLLAATVEGIAGVTISRPVESNAVFARLPDAVSDAIREDFQFYSWDLSAQEVRWMVSFDTQPEHITAFVDLLKRHSAHG